MTYNVFGGTLSLTQSIRKKGFETIADKLLLTLRMKMLREALQASQHVIVKLDTDELVQPYVRLQHAKSVWTLITSITLQQQNTHLLALTTLNTSHRNRTVQFCTVNTASQCCILTKYTISICYDSLLLSHVFKWEKMKQPTHRWRCIAGVLTGFYVIKILI